MTYPDNPEGVPQPASEPTAWPSGPMSNPLPGGYGYGNSPEQILVTIGDISCTQTQVITPSGTFPIAGSQWAVTDMSITSERMSQLGLVLAIIGFFMVCFLSLLFLLMKERTTTGYIQVTVLGANGMTHVANIPAPSQMTMMDISSRVGYARSLA